MLGIEILFWSRHKIHRDDLPECCDNFSLKICRARKIRERTAASLMPRVAPTSRGDISSIVDRIRGSRSFEGKAAISLVTADSICAPCKASSGPTPDEAGSEI